MSLLPGAADLTKDGDLALRGRCQPQLHLHRGGGVWLPQPEVPFTCRQQPLGFIRVSPVVTQAWPLTRRTHRRPRPSPCPPSPPPRRGGWPLSWLRRGSPSLLPRPWAGPPSGNDCSFINPWSILHSVVSAIFISSRKPRSRVGGAAPSVWRERPGPKVGHGRGLTGPGHRLRPGYNCPELSEWDRKGHVPRGGQGSGVSGQPGRAESPGSTHGKWD